MDLRQLRYFSAVAQHGSFSRASGKLHISQPALSEQIAALETELGVKLFLRHSRGATTTPQGLKFLARIEEALELLDAARAELVHCDNTTVLECRLGLPTTITTALGLPLLDRGKLLLPHVHLTIVEGMTGHLDKWLDQGDLDAAVLFGGTTSISGPAFAFEKLYLIGPRHGPFEHLSHVVFSDVLTLPMIHSTRGHQLRQTIDERSARFKRPLNLIAEIDSMAQIKNLVFQGQGYTIMPRSSLSPDWIGERVRCWPIADPEGVIALHLVPGERFKEQPRSAETLKALEAVIRELMDAGLWTQGLDDGVGEVFAASH